MSGPRPVAEMDFETAMKELEEIVATLETGKVDLNSSIAAYERGEALKARCEQLLRDAEARIERITLSRDGTAAGVEPLDPV
jgi:exodeoxyribonuclease VII small subunit